MVADGSEPVLVQLSVPGRVVERGPADGLVVPLGQFADDQLLDLTLPDEHIADFLATAVHRPGGFAARTDEASRALALLAATAAALCGEDIRRALTSPDIDFLTGLSSGAVDAVREVLLGIESETPVELEHALRALLRTARS
ncbi:hypothetical protein [Nocardia carnea]|uniref:hypothetical protein n=1 Tax=Nocardia carnea TaxID=37328 RepID=UPI002456F9B3|nr:hypothetical protein [Nocardia carnea]